MGNRYFRRHWDQSRGDQFDALGAATYYFEVGEDGWPFRQIEVYDSGPVLRYGPNRPEEEFGGLGKAQLDDVEDWSSWATTEEMFDEAWSDHP